ncbi:anti-sigma factor [Phormidium tenue FACHB-886]|nr:anti-sigma factor [Phormidium tenue FACHB-886]
MTRSPLPDHWQELLAGYTLGDLSPEETETVQHLLVTHPELVAEAERLQEVLGLMAYALPGQEPSLLLKEKILGIAQTTPQLAEAAPETAASNPADTSNSSGSLTELGRSRRFAQPGSKRRSRTSFWGLSAIAAAALVALGVDNYRLRQDAQEARSIIAALQQRGTLTYALEGTAQANNASGSVMVAEGQQVIMVVKDLPVLPSGQVYRLWAMPPSGKDPTFCGQFNASEAGSTNTQWLAPASACQSTTVQMLITIENALDPPVPKGSLVMKSRV